MRIVVIVMSIVNLFMCLRAYIKGCYSWEIGVLAVLTLVLLVGYLISLKK